MTSCPGVGRQTADLVAKLFRRPVPVDEAIFGKYLGGLTWLDIECEAFLRSSHNFSGNYVVDSFESQFRTEFHQTVMDVADIIGWPDLYLLLGYYVACIYFMLKEERRYAGFSISVHDGSVYRSCSTVTR